MNIFKQLFKSIYSPKDIAVFRFQGIGKTILYVFLLTLISLIPPLISISTEINAAIQTGKTVIEDELPSFTIEDGQLKSSSKVPITIEKGDFTVIFDSTGTVKLDDIKDDNTVALLKNQFAFSGGGRIQTYEYSMIDSLKLTNKELAGFIDSIESSRYIIIGIAGVLILILTSASSFIEVSILALIGLAIKKMAGRRLNYGQIWRMAAYSETLPTIFFTIMAAIGTTVPNSFLINWFVAIIVLYLAINEIPKPKAKIK